MSHKYLSHSDAFLELTQNNYIIKFTCAGFTLVFTYTSFKVFLTNVKMRETKTFSLNKGQRGLQQNTAYRKECTSHKI